MKRKIFAISVDLLKFFFANGTYPEKSVLVKNGLPDDAKICDVKFDGFNENTINILVESEQFEDVPFGNLYPYLGTTVEILRRRYDDK